MGNWKTKLLVAFIIILLTLVTGIYTGIKNTSDYQISELEFDELSANVEVYRNEQFVPTIIAENEFDLFFAQGYEMARDRLWQLEFFRSVGKGELSRLFGDSQLTSDKYLRVLSMRKAASNTLEKLDQKYLDVIEAFVQGINKYIEFHQNNLPLEFVLLGVEPKQWTPMDVLTMQGVLSRTLSIGGLNQEVLRNRMAQEFGFERASEIYPIPNPKAELYFNSLNESDLAPLEELNLEVMSLMNFANDDVIDGSNNWVVGGEKTDSGIPIVSNDPHLGLQTPSIWWRVHLYAPTFHVEGFSLPGTPGIIVGHNDHVAWGVTNTGLDAVDLFHFETRNNGEEYFHDNQWKQFTEINHEIPLQGDKTEEYTVKYTEYGPVLDPDLYDVPDDGRAWVFRWTLLENYDRDRIFKAVIDYNRASNQAEFLSALEYFGVPGQNFVFGTVDGDFGYQFTGIIPIRNVEFAGLLPQNGSDSRYGWNGTVPYTEQYREINPENGFFVTANERVDTRDEYYVSASYAIGYRADRITSRLSDLDTATVDDMKSIQGDIYNLYAELVLDNTLADIEDGDYRDDIAETAAQAIEILKNWNMKMDRKERGPTIFTIFRIFLEEATFRDEFNNATSLTYFDYDSKGEYGITEIIADRNNNWFDDISTTTTETRSDIVEKAFSKTVDYLLENVSRFVRNWRYQRVHEVVFEHPIGSQIGLFNAGGIASDGSELTVKASGSTPNFNEDGSVEFKQTHGSSFRFVAQVDRNWDEVYGMIAPGQSEHFFIRERGDNVKDWVNNVTYRWNYSIERDEKPSFTFISV